MAAPTFGAIMLGTTDADRLRQWYVDVLSPRVDHGILFFGEIVMVCDQRDDVADKNPEPQRQILNFRVDDAIALARDLDKLGVTWLAEVTEREHAWIGTLIDPDDNYVQIVQEKHR
jgi:catechol 2,3-dioxygenase-like lactoylglutathione lyase family enzyme